MGINKLLRVALQKKSTEIQKDPLFNILLLYKQYDLKPNIKYSYTQDTEAIK